MSTTELKEIVDKSTMEERLFLQAYLDHLAREADPENGRDLDRRWNETEKGSKVNLADALKLHEQQRWHNERPRRE